MVSTNDQIKNFYSEIQFNTGEKLEDDSVIPSKTLQTLLNMKMFAGLGGITDVLELGCGNGWLSNRISSNYPHIKVTGIDIVEPLIDYAKTSTNDHANFFVEDIFETSRTADLVISIGALHHIPNYSMVETITRALDCAERFAFIGLYHKESRNAMFEWFEQFPEKEWYDVFTELTPYLTDDVQRKSWFEDQFYNPYEQSIDFDTLNKVSMITGASIISTSFKEDVNFKDMVFRKLNNKEFTSGFIYTLFDKTDKLDVEDHINDIRKKDPYIYR